MSDRESGERDFEEDTIMVSSTEQSIEFARSTPEPQTPESVAGDVVAEAERRYDVASLTAGTVLGVVAYDPETEEIDEIRWEESPGDEPA